MWEDASNICTQEEEKMGVVSNIIFLTHTYPMSYIMTLCDPFAELFSWLFAE